LTIGRRALAVAIALLLAAQVIRNAAVGALAPINPQAVRGIWPGHPDVALSLGMIEIAAAARRGGAVERPEFEMIDAAATKAPLAPEPFLVRGVQAQLAGDGKLAERAFQAAEWRDPRSLPARYFLADHYLRSGNVQGGLLEFATLARLAPSGILSVTPFVASYARDSSRWPQIRMLFRAEPELQEMTLEAMAADPANSTSILALADRAHRSAASPWLPRLLAALVAHGEYGKARIIWAEVAGVRPKTGELLFDSDFSEDAPPPPFNWALTSSTVGLAERQSGGRLHVIYYGQEDGVLASQLLVLMPGRYRLAMRVVGSPPQKSSLRWSVACANAQTPLASFGLDSLVGRPWIFIVPVGCGAQRLDLAGSSSDIAEQVEVTITGLSLTKVGANG
jgi:hypothetical protein